MELPISTLRRTPVAVTITSLRSIRSGCRVTLILFSCLTVTSREAKPMYENTRISPSETSISYSPSKLVETPFVEPLTTILTPPKGTLS